MSRKSLALVGLAIVVPVAAILAWPTSREWVLGLADSGEFEGRAIRHWVGDLKSSDAAVRMKAMVAVGKIGPDARGAAAPLAHILATDPDPKVRTQAALALSKISPAGQEAIPALTEALHDSELAVRSHAARGLAKFKDDARSALPELIKAVQDESNHTAPVMFDQTIHELAIQAIGKVTAGTDDAVPTLKDLLRPGANRETRLAALGALRDVGPGAKSLAPTLRVIAKGQETALRQAAIQAIQAVGEPLDGPLPADFVEMQLPEAEKKYLWKIEHHGNLLMKYGFPAMASALKKADGAELAKFLAADFAGSDLNQPRVVRTTEGIVQGERLQDSGATPNPLTAPQFVARLLELRKVFTAKPPGVKLAMMTLSPKERGKVDGRWVGKVQLRLHGEHISGAPAEIVAVFRYEIDKPTEEIMAKPGWVHRGEFEQVLITKAPYPLFVENAVARGFKVDQLYDNWMTKPFDPTTGGVYVTDFDRDGLLDVLITDKTGSNLYKGQAGGKFADVTEAMGLSSRNLKVTVAAWVDLDGDGWDDLIVGTRVFRNEGGKKLTDVTAQCTLPFPRDFAAIVVADYDRDGKLDLYFARSGNPGGMSWLESKSDARTENVLARNLGNWKFQDVTKSANAGGDHRSTFTACWLDANNDGWPDLLVPNEFGDSGLLINQKNGTFKEHPLADVPADYGTMGAVVGDVNNDGQIDIYCANMYSKAGTRVIGNMLPDTYTPDVMTRLRRLVAGSQLHLNQGNTSFKQVGIEKQVAAVGWAYGASLADFDGDGLLDIYGTAGYISRNRDEPDG